MYNGSLDLRSWVLYFYTMKKFNEKVKSVGRWALNLYLTTTLTGAVLWFNQKIILILERIWEYILKAADACARAWEVIGIYVLYSVGAAIAGVLIYGTYQYYLRVRQYFFAMLGLIFVCMLAIQVINLLQARRRLLGPPKA